MTRVENYTHSTRRVRRLSIRYQTLALYTTVFFALVTALHYFGTLGESSEAVLYYNLIIPLFFLGGFSLTAMMLVRLNKLLIWTPAFLFLAHVALFYGLGPLVHVLGNDASIAKLQQGLFKLTDTELLGTNLLNLVGTSSVLAGILLITATKILNPVRKPTYFSRGLNPETVAAWFFILGVANKYLIVFPFKIGITNFVPLGIFMHLEQLIDLGFALVAYLAVTKGGRWRLLLWIALPIHLSFVLLEFRKGALILALLMPAFGAFLAHGSLRRLSVWVIVSTLVFGAMQPLTLFGRAEIRADSGNINYANLTRRLQIVGYAFTHSFDAIDTTQIDEQGSWMRVAYSGPQAWAMRERDRGNANDSLSRVWIVFIPRLFWPDKPVGISPSQDFYQAVSGTDSRTRVGITVYADAYWNGGWANVVGFGLLIGAFFGIMSKFTMYWLASGQFLYYPAILLAADIAMRGMTNWIIAGFFGPIPLLITFVILIRIVQTTSRWRLPRNVIKHLKFTA